MSRDFENTPCIGIETRKGLLFFTRDEYSRSLMQHYLQRLTNHYFDVDFTYGPLRVYESPGVPAKAISEVNPPKTTLGQYSYLPVSSLSKSEQRHMIRVYENPLTADTLHLSQMLTYTQTSLSSRNRNIGDALFALENYDKTLQHLNGQTQDRLTLQQLATVREDYQLQEKILQQYADVRGHCPIEKLLNHPSDFVEIDGLVLHKAHRQILLSNKCLSLPETGKHDPQRSYAWLDPQGHQLRHGEKPPQGMTVDEVITLHRSSHRNTKQPLKPSR